MAAGHRDRLRFHARGRKRTAGTGTAAGDPPRGLASGHRRRPHHRRRLDQPVTSSRDGPPHLTLTEPRPSRPFAAAEYATYRVTVAPGTPRERTRSYWWRDTAVRQ